MPNLLVVGSMAQVKHRTGSEAFPGLIDGRRERVLPRDVGLIEAEYAEICSRVVGAQSQQLAYEIVQGWGILAQAVPIVICCAEEPKSCLIDLLHLHTPPMSRQP